MPPVVPEGTAPGARGAGPTGTDGGSRSLTSFGSMETLIVIYVVVGIILSTSVNIKGSYTEKENNWKADLDVDLKKLFFWPITLIQSQFK
jgi:hypothetical protein